MMKKSFALSLAVAILGTYVPAPLLAQVSTSASKGYCDIPRGYTVGFFNGVWNMPEDARRASENLKGLLGEYRNNQPVSYEVFYNHTGSSVGSNGYQDIAEVFIQRDEEYRKSEEEKKGETQKKGSMLEGRYELAWASISDGGSMLKRIHKTGLDPKVARKGLFSLFSLESLGDLGRRESNLPTELDYAQHRAMVDKLAIEGQKLMLVAHSQGNLFVNRAFDYAKTKIATNSVATYHIAPASVTLRGKHILSNYDFVIKLLRVSGRGTVPEDNLSMEFFRDDMSGHKLLETYLNPKKIARARIQTEVYEAMDALETPEAKGSPGLFTATLIWDGPGDVDLHVYEPGGSHVHYLEMKGSVGELDVDNRVGGGPEHYYVPCDPSVLQGGSYGVGINNFKGADGRKATLTVDFAEGGQSLSKTIELPAQQGRSGDNPSPLAHVLVERCADGRWRARLPSDRARTCDTLAGTRFATEAPAWSSLR